MKTKVVFWPYTVERIIVEMVSLQGWSGRGRGSVETTRMIQGGHTGVALAARAARDHGDLVEFALDLHCAQATLIVEAFASDWFSKHTFEGGITEAKAASFASFALRKLRAELNQRSEAHA